MKKLILALLVVLTLGITSCTDDDDNLNVIGTKQTTTYNLISATEGINIGSVSLIKNQDNTTSISVEMNTPPTEPHFVHLHTNNAAATGEVILTLNPLDEETGASTTTFSTLDDGTEINYEQLMIFDGYIDVHNEQENTPIAYTDIGMNIFTGESKIYDLTAEAGSEINGTIKFERRLNNQVLATVRLENSQENTTYPIKIYQDNAIDGETPVLELQTITSTQTISNTHIDIFEDVSTFYDDMRNYDGHVRVYEETAGLNNLVAKADIGTNELTGNTQSYTMLNPEGIENGTFNLYERQNGETLAEIELLESPGMDLSAFIHSGEFGNSNSISATLNLVAAETGIGKTNLTALNNQTTMTYEDWLAYDGHLTVFTPSNEVFSYANIGANVE